MTDKRLTLLLVDVQKDFHPGGSLAIPSANDDAERIAAFIKKHSSKIDRIVATMDSHHKLHIAHPQVWEDPVTGEQPAPFTQIRHDDIKNGKWKPKDSIDLNKMVVSKYGNIASLQEYTLEYTKSLETKGRFVLCVWPEHCLIGTPGHSMVDNVRAAIDEWSIATGKSPEFVHKGMNNFTEMYSVLEAEVPTHDETSFNKKLMESLQSSEALLVCGQAMSHCVNYTLRGIVNHWDEGKKPISSIYLLTDCASAVPTFEKAAEEFQHDMKEAGVTLCTSEDF